jgi:hypothetical protein
MHASRPLDEPARFAPLRLPCMRHRKGEEKGKQWGKAAGRCRCQCTNTGYNAGLLCTQRVAERDVCRLGRVRDWVWFGLVWLGWHRQVELDVNGQTDSPIGQTQAQAQAQALGRTGST